MTAPGPADPADAAVPHVDPGSPAKRVRLRGGGAIVATAARRPDDGSAVPAGLGWRGGWRDGVGYGALGLPLAFVALPLYVVLPNHYASVFGVPLALLGAVLLGARLLDAVADPLIGRWADALLARSARRAAGAAAMAAVVLAVGFRGLFFPPLQGTPALLTWCAALLAVTYLSYSVVTVIHQAWGARLGGDEPQRARIVAWREGLALAGVLVASVLPSVVGLNVTSLVFGAALAIGIVFLWHAPQPRPSAGGIATPVALRLPFSNRAFRRLLLVYLVNGIASAVPATLVLFFIRDRLQAVAYEPLFLASYFAAGALSIPLWVRVVGRFGLAGTWLIGMVLAVAVFAWAALLGAGDVAAYTAVCVLSGVALGADLTLPSALLAGVIQRAGHDSHAEGAYFGWWNFATKLNLALAAGVALPVLQAFGYAPGGHGPQALQALTIAYCVLPCVLKLAAGALLYFQWIRPSEGTP
jgi:Na+/melibiose symporter-like transporter